VRLHAIVSDLETARVAVRGGATVVQLRVKGASTAELIEIGRPLRELPAILIVNDDVDAALALDADGVHLGRDDPGAKRAIESGMLLGISATTVEEAKRGEELGAAYLGVGPIWETPTKPDADPPIGLEGLRKICEAVSVPVIAIGGIDASNAAACKAAGAAGVAVVRAASDAEAVNEAFATR
jgi:thiamine-phosphate pyrophosphorylase